MVEKHIVIGSDHAGYELKEKVKEYLEKAGYQIDDKGVDEPQRTDYPQYAHAVSQSVLDRGILGVLICGSGNGVCMTANKHKGVRAALAWTVELASLARAHNNANILCLPARFITDEEAYAMLDSFFQTSFEGGRHEQRVAAING